MKKGFIGFVIILGMSHVLWALDSVSSIPIEQKKLITKIIKTLQLPESKDVEEKIYQRLEPFLQTENWNVRWTSNASAANSKIEGSATQVCDLMIYNNNRVVNSTFIYFSEQKQLFSNTKEFVETDATTALSKFKKTKEDTGYIKKEENNNYAYFQKKDYMDYELYHIKSPVGMIVYESTIFIDIK